MTDADIQAVEQVKNIVDVISAGTVVAVLTGVLPALAALFTIVWTALRIYESVTVQKWLHPDAPKQPPVD